MADDSTIDVVAPPGWTLGRKIAIGGSSVVHEVSAASGVPAVLKWGRWRDRDVHDRFAREAEVLQELGASASPRYIAHGAIDEWPYIVMEQVSGETLAAWMARSGDRGALGEVVAILMRIAEALELVHHARYIHLDLKPENVVIGVRDTRLLDFGLAVREGETVTKVGTIVGTVHYLAPEQIKIGPAIDRRTDIYSFGVIAYEMIAGQPPFIGERRAIEYQHQVARPPALRDVRQLPPQLEELVEACLAKHPDARPATARALIERLTDVAAHIQTLKGVGALPKKVLGAKDKVVLAWIDGGDPIAVSRAISDVHGIIVRSRGRGILAAFASQFHDAPLEAAVATCRELARGGCRVVIHATSVLVRRSAQGKPSFYGPEIEQPASWTPKVPFNGIVLTAAAAELAGTSASPAPGMPGFARDVQAERTTVGESDREPPLVGRDRLVQDISAIARAGGMTISLHGPEGSGKTRVISALAERLRAAHREVVAIRGRRRLLGDHLDDDRLLDALGGTGDVIEALGEAGARRAIVVVDDAEYFSPAAREQLTRADLPVSRVISSRDPLFEVMPGDARRLSFAIHPLSFGDAERLLRLLLQPARLIPDVLLQRLAIRASGNPGLIVALARDIKQRGGIRRNAGGDDWYVAADEIDTLLAAPSEAWVAARGLEELPPELVRLVRVAAVLGPTFTAEELAVVGELADAKRGLDWLARDGTFAERNGSFEFTYPSMQEAIYRHTVDDRATIHARALKYWLDRPAAGLVGWLARVAYHAIGCGDMTTAATTSATLAREARKRGDEDQARLVEARLLDALVGAAPAAVANVVRALDED